MKRLAFVITLIITAFYSFAQWELQNPIPTDVPLNDIQFIDANNGWAVGENGSILNSTDGGETWNLQYSEIDTILDITTSFEKVFFTDMEHGWAIGWHSIPFGGEPGIIYRTDDGGANWESIYSNPYGSFSDIWFVNADTGWVVGAENGRIILKTIDGGDSWIIQYNESNSYLSAVCFVNATTGWATGGNGTILYTSDGGSNWNHQIIGDSVNFKSVSFTDELNGWVLGNMSSWPFAGKILKTNDGGITWDLIYSFGDYEAFDLGSIYFSDSENGWLTYEAAYSGWSILHTTDGGENWYDQNTGMTFYDLPSLFFYDSLTGWAVGENVIIKTSNSGENWAPQNSVSNSHLSSVCFIDNDTGWALGSRPVTGIMVWSNSMLITTDGGVNWNLSYVGAPNELISDLDFIDSNHGWAVGGNMVKAGGVTYKTVDGGENWQEFYTESGMLSSVKFVSTTLGWAVGEEGTILITQDGGVSWETQTSGTMGDLTDVYFTDQENGWVVGGGRIILKTNDGGETWVEKSYTDEGTLTKVYFIDSDHGWAVGEFDIIPNNHYDVIYTSDGGDTWLEIFSTSGIPINDVYFSDLMNGWAIGNLSTIVYTKDGGETWQDQDNGSINSLRSIQFMDSQEGWIVGDYGTILHTDNGGTVGSKEFEVQSPKPEVICYPNPFATSTTIEYHFHHPQTVTITFYNQFGKQVDVIEERQQRGINKIVWSPRDIADGIYYFRLEAGKQLATGKVILIK